VWGSDTFPSMNDDWRDVALGEFVALQRGHDLPEARRRVGDVPVLGSFGITGLHDQARAQGPGVTIGRSGASLGAVSYSSMDYWPLNTVLYVKDFHGNDPRFAYFLLRTIDFRRFNSGSAQPSLNRNHIHPMRIRIPPVAEQRRISTLLGAFDDKIEVNRRISETLDEIARTLFTSWFVDFDPVRGTTAVPGDIRRLYPDRLVDSKIGPVPGGWEVEHLSTELTVSREMLDPRGNPDELFDHFSLPAYDAGRIPTSERGAAIKSTKLRVLDGCVLLSKLNPRIPRVWWPSAAGESRKIASTEFVVALPCDGITRSFLFSLFTSAPFRKTLTSLVRGTSGSHQRVGVTDLLGIEVVVPPRELVERFDAIVAPMFDQQEALTAESKTLADLRDTLLPKLISGEIRLNRA